MESIIQFFEIHTGASFVCILAGAFFTTDRFINLCKWETCQWKIKYAVEWEIHGDQNTRIWWEEENEMNVEAEINEQIRTREYKKN